MSLDDHNGAYHILLPIRRAAPQGGCAVIVGSRFEPAFPSFEAAAAFAAERFPDRQCQIGRTDAAEEMAEALAG
jgi:hypothetical protein